MKVQVQSASSLTKGKKAFHDTNVLKSNVSITWGVEGRGNRKIIREESEFHSCKGGKASATTFRHDITGDLCVKNQDMVTTTTTKTTLTSTITDSCLYFIKNNKIYTCLYECKENSKFNQNHWQSHVLVQPLSCLCVCAHPVQVFERLGVWGTSLPPAEA